MIKRISLIIIIAFALVLAPFINGSFALGTEIFTPDIISGEAAVYLESYDTSAYTLVHEVKVHNISSSTAHNVQVEIPLMDKYSPEYSRFIGEQLSPYPKEVVTDTMGHRFAVYNIPSIISGGTIIFQQKYVIELSTASYTFDRAAVKEEYSSVEMSIRYAYTQPEPDIESDHTDIISFMQGGTEGQTNPYRIASALFSLVNMATTYTNDVLDQSALATLHRGTGNCDGYSNLYIALLRAAGIPARKLSGYLYIPSEHYTEEYLDAKTGGTMLNNLRHAWVEFYLPEIGWVAADPTFTNTFEINGTVHKLPDWSYFANIDSSRRYIFLRMGSNKTEEIYLQHTGGNLAKENIFASQLFLGKQYLPFNDLTGHWAVEQITHCVERGFFNGVSPDRFAPEQKMSRAMFVTVLGRLFEAHGNSTIPYSSDITQFSDIRQDDYYAPYLGWALDYQLINGYGNGLFGPDNSITREEMAKIIAEFCLMIIPEPEENEEEKVSEAEQHTFTDQEKVSDWALSGVEYCVKKEIISGHPDNSFKPADFANRSQVAAILQRLDNLIIGLEAQTEAAKTQ